MDRYQRIIQPELLEGAGPVQVELNLRDLSRIHRWLGGRAVVRSLFGGLAAPDERFTVLNVGAASGDSGNSLRDVFSRATVISLDRVPMHLTNAHPPRVAADAFQLPFRESGFDFVLCSLFLHHFTDDEVRRLLAGFYKVARRAVVAVDLHRHPLAHSFLPATRWLFRWSELTLHDGPVSVQAAFQPKELAVLARDAGLDNIRVASHWPWFRISLVARR